MQKRTNQCECSDHGCPVHNGWSACLENGEQILYRVDMNDETGTLFCAGCAADAMQSGLFSESKRESK